MVAIRFGVLTVSDTCSTGSKVDTAGPAVVSAIEAALPDAVIAARALVADDKTAIQRALLEWCDEGCHVILTVGGTGFSPRDVTPEATEGVVERRAPGMAHAMLRGSLKVTTHAMLSRATCGIRGRTLIVNLPGSAKAAVECFDFVSAALPHAVDLLRGDEEAVAATHQSGGNSAASVVPRMLAADRVRHSPYPMLEVDAAQRLICEALVPSSAAETLHFEAALDRVLAEDVASSDPLPPFPASIKDGYAVIAADGVGVRHVADVRAAGDDPTATQLVSGQVVRISTGAPLPPGADAVVQVEDTELVRATPEGAEVEVRICRQPTPGQDIRKIGSDIPANAKLLNKGELVAPAHVGLLAAIGATQIRVVRRPSVGIVSTGNELQDPNLPLHAGRIRDSNKSALMALFRRNNCAAVDCGIARDTPDDVKRALTGAFASHDFVVTTGGVSMGEYDVVKAVLEHDFGAKVHFGRVNMKPGKPMTFATCQFRGKTKYVFALPGNPVSAMVTSILFVIPALKRTENRPTPHKMKAVLGETLALDERPEYARASTHVDDQGRTIATVTGNQISSRLSSFVDADVLLCLPPKTQERPRLEKGSVVEAIRI